jgi:hypothetical protein
MESGDENLLTEEQLRHIAREYNIPTHSRPPWTESLNPQLLDILRTAGSPDASGTQSSAAITTLCSILQSQKDDDSFQKIMWFGGIWLDCFQIYLAKLELTRSKAVRSFLNLLINLLQRQDTPPDIKTQVLELVVKPIVSRSERGKVKSALSALGHLITKHVVSIDELLPHFTGHKFSPDYSAEALEDIASVFRTLFRWAQFHELAPAVGQTASVFWKLAKKRVAGFTTEEISADLPIELVCWIDPLLEVVKQYPESLLRLKSHLFSTLFIIDINDYASFLEQLGVQRLLLSKTASNQRIQSTIYNEYELLLSSLQTGKELGIVQESGIIGTLRYWPS